MLLTGSRFMPWQRQVAGVFCEHDDHGLLVHDTCCLLVPRQAGKTTLVEALVVWAARRHPERTVVYAAQTRLAARERIIEELELKRLARSPFAGDYRVRRSVGQESLRWSNLSQIALISSQVDAGHGMTIDCSVVDEAWAQEDWQLVDSLGPTMVTRPDPQLVFLSTVGDGGDVLLQHYQQLGREGRIPFFEWSAPDDADRDDPAVWAAAHPALGHTITAERIADRLRVLKPAQFDRAYLNRRPVADSHDLVAASRWRACRVDPPGLHVDAQVTVAVDVMPDRSSGTVAVCGRDGDTGPVVTVVERRPGVDWIPGTVAALAQSRRVVGCCFDSRGAAATLRMTLGQATPTVEWQQYGTTDVVAAAGTFLDAILADPPQLVHTGQVDLDRAVGAARKRPVGDAWAFGRKNTAVDVTPLVAASLARWQYEHWTGTFHRDLFVY